MRTDVNEGKRIKKSDTYRNECDANENECDTNGNKCEVITSHNIATVIIRAFILNFRNHARLFQRF